MLILGCGNPDRADDAAGLLVARRLRELGTQARELGGEALELIDAWSGEADVIIVDAVKSGAPPGTITVWDARTSPLPACQFRCSTHALGVAEAIELARALDRLPSKLIVVGIEGNPIRPRRAALSRKSPKRSSAWPDASPAATVLSVQPECGAAYRGCGPAFLRVQPA